MLEPPGQSRARQAVDRGDETGSGPRWPEPVVPEAAAPRLRPGWGRLPAWAGVLMVLAAATLGAAFTAASHRDPGRALGALVIVGTLAAATSVRGRSAYAIIPVPALAYAVAAVAAGSINDRTVDTTRTALALSAAQWIADGFIAMTAATALAVLIALARWLQSLRKAR
jgi:hypothetical protein